MQTNFPKQPSLVKIPQAIELTIFLIQQELKSRIITKKLHQLGFDKNVCFSGFSTLIFSMMDLNNCSDEFYQWYLNQLDVFCKDINLSDDEALTQQAFDFYVHLLMEKRRK